MVIKGAKFNLCQKTKSNISSEQHAGKKNLRLDLKLSWEKHPLGLNRERTRLLRGRPGLDPCVRRTPGGGNGSPLQCYCLENPMDRGAWQETVPGSQRVGHD